MAGDWIKVRTDLGTSPKVVRIASALRADRLRVVGALHAVWCLFDAHSVDGILRGYDAETVDELIGFAGFASAMAAVEWLGIAADGLKLPDFDAHNGASAKRRAMEADRKRSARASAHDADKKRTREEKRREEKKERAATPRAKPKRALPDDFAVTPGMTAWAAERAPDAAVDRETEKFVNHYRAKGEARADWPASWRNWMLNAQGYAERDGVGRAQADSTAWGDNLGAL